MHSYPGNPSLQWLTGCSRVTLPASGVYHPFACMRPRAGMIALRLPFSSDGIHIGQKPLAGLSVFLFGPSPVRVLMP